MGVFLNKSYSREIFRLFLYNEEMSSVRDSFTMKYLLDIVERGKSYQVMVTVSRLLQCDCMGTNNIFQLISVNEVSEQKAVGMNMETFKKYYQLVSA